MVPSGTEVTAHITVCSDRQTTATIIVVLKKDYIGMFDTSEDALTLKDVPLYGCNEFTFDFTAIKDTNRCYPVVGCFEHRSYFVTVSINYKCVSGCDLYQDPNTRPHVGFLE